MRFAVLTLMLPGIALGQTNAQWTFKPGDVFFYERTAKDVQAVTINKNQTLKQDVRSSWTYRFEVQKSTGPSAVLDVVFEKVQVQHLAGPGTIENKLLEKMRGGHLVVTLDAAGNVSKVDGYDALIDLAAEKKTDLVRVAKQLWPESLVRQEMTSLFSELPLHESSWKNEGLLITPPLGQFATTLAVNERKLDRAEHLQMVGTIKGRYVRPDQPTDLFRITGGHVDLEKGTWSATFDREHGRLLNRTMSYELRGELTVELNAMPTPITIEIRREIATKRVAGL